jgi:methylmalonyl-CoA mutase
MGQMGRGLGFSTGPADKLPPLELRRFAAPFEELRDASDAWLARRGHRPRVFLANMGAASDFAERSAYARNFFEAGGFEVLDMGGFVDAHAAVLVFTKSEARIAAVCSSDTIYRAVIPEVAPQLKNAGARTVVVAGDPAENLTTWRAAGVDRFIFRGCHVVESLGELLREEGVIELDEGIATT